MATIVTSDVLASQIAREFDRYTAVNCSWATADTSSVEAFSTWLESWYAAEAAPSLGQRLRVALDAQDVPDYRSECGGGDGITWYAVPAVVVGIPDATLCTGGWGLYLVPDTETCPVVAGYEPTEDGPEERTHSAYYSIRTSTLDSVEVLLPGIPAAEVAGYVLGDWPEGEEHQAWLDSAGPAEIARWVQSGYELALAPDD